jgi:hypothetical protein
MKDPRLNLQFDWRLTVYAYVLLIIIVMVVIVIWRALR